MKIMDFLKKTLEGKLSLDQQEEFLRTKSDVTPHELADVVKFLMKQMPSKPHIKNCIDICGTGGSGLNRINTSTISAFILASLGVGIAKHGNKAASGRFGSFDLLESLGFKFGNNVADIERLYKYHNLAFFFAPFFHPVMKHFAEVRKKIGKPTFFNILGPLLNPAATKRQIIGTTFKDKMGIIGEACKLLGREKVYVVCGEDSLDEVTLTGKTFVTEINNGKIKNYTVSPEDFGIKKAKFEEIKGGDAKYNTEIAVSILKGKCETRHLDLVLINSALALKLTDKTKTLKDGYKMAMKAVKTGVCYEKFEQYKTLSSTESILLEIVENKKREIEKRKLNHPLNKTFVAKITTSKMDFATALKKGKPALIAEIKRSSPSAGKIHKGKFSPVEIAKKYENSGVNAISVLCDEKFFKGSLNYLKEVSKNIKKTPLLCKDFIIDEYQIYEARKYGADAILLIASILSEQQTVQFLKVAEKLKMAAICEIHTLSELEKVLKTSAKIIGINNRNLNTFETNISTTNELAKHIPKDKIIISESGIHSKEDIKSLPKNVNAILVGTAIMKGTQINEFINK
ncbi:MAG: anthranilate phosphoribosyltransferase [Candidatus Gracilibacteria bacterium]|jgi:anthranilate phosphoribosyltransferase